MEKQKMFSILIPCYNTEKYVRDCIESVLKQNVDDCEILCLDDGSSDKTREILKTYKNNSKVKIFFSRHVGVSQARNKLLKRAKGKYLVFLDSDDLMCDNFLRKLYDYALNNEFDCHVGSFVHVQDDENLTVTREDTLDPNGFNGKSQEEVFDHMFYERCIYAMCRFIVRNEIVKRNKIYFKKNIVHEDEDWVTKILLFCEKFCCLDCIQFLYRRRKDSITTSPNTFNYVSKLKIAIDLFNLSEKYTGYKKKHLIRKVYKICKELHYITKEIINQEEV